MPLTRRELLAMKETRLQEEVLVPLFKAKGYQDVHIHQGTTEFGKDIVMWKPGDFGERVNYAVVAKAKKITGSASGSAGAGTVATQIQQCFGRSYYDHVTGEEQKINRVYVVNSQEIPKEAIEATRSIIGNSSVIDRATTFLDGDRLWEELEKYTPEKLIHGKLREIQEVLDRASPDHRLVAKTTGEFTVEPKRPGAAPPTVSGKIVFPNTPEGRAMRDEFDRHLSTGSELTLPKQFIQELQIPDFLIPYLGFIVDGDYELVIKSRPSPIPLLIKIEMTCDDGHNVTLAYISLRMTKGGKDEISFSNEDQPVPWKVTVNINRKERRFTFSVKIEFNNLNVKQASQGLYFLKAMALGGSFRIEHIDTGLTIVTQRVEPSQYEMPDQRMLDLLDKVLFIQEKTRTPIPFINGPMTKAHATAILDTVNILERGAIDLEVQRTSINTKDIDFAKAIAESSEAANPQPFAIQYQEAPKPEIMGVVIPLGPVIYSWDSVYINEEVLRLLKSAVETFSPDTGVDIWLTPAEGCTARAIYPIWILPEIQERLQLTWGDPDDSGAEPAVSKDGEDEQDKR